MAIQAITGLNPAKANYNISFGNKKNNLDPEMPNGGSGLGYALPLAILMVTSPMNSVSAAEQYNRYVAAQQPTELVYTQQEESLPEDTYMLVPSTQEPQEPQKKVSKEAFRIHKTLDKQYLSITGISTDSNKVDAEKMFLYYSNRNKNPDYKVKAKIFGYCPEPRDDGRNIAIIGLVGDNELCVAAFPSEYKPVFDRSVMSEIRNNNAVKVYTRDEMSAMLEGSMDEIPGIEEFVPPAKCTATGD